MTLPAYTAKDVARMADERLAQRQARQEAELHEAEQQALAIIIEALAKDTGTFGNGEYWVQTQDHPCFRRVDLLSTPGRFSALVEQAIPGMKIIGLTLGRSASNQGQIHKTTPDGYAYIRFRVRPDTPAQPAKEQ